MKGIAYSTTATNRAVMLTKDALEAIPRASEEAEKWD
jgi:hypothetical protein